MFHHMAYIVTTGAATTLQDIPGVPDTVFTRTNNHFIFTDQLQLLGAAFMGTTVTQGQIFSPSLVPYGNLNIWPLNRTLLPPSFPRIMDFTDRPFKLPTNEEIQALESDTAIDTITAHLWIAPMNWNMNQPIGQFRSVLKTTAAIATTAATWTGPNPISFGNAPIGGWYNVAAAYCFCATARAFRLYFPRSPTISGRQMRPGDLVSAVRGDMVKPGWAFDFGPWGAFHTFEPVQLELLGDAAGAATQELYLVVDYLGQGDAGAYPMVA